MMAMQNADYTTMKEAEVGTASPEPKFVGDQMVLEGFEPTPAQTEKQKEREQIKAARKQIRERISSDEGLKLIYSFFKFLGIGAMLATCGIVKTSANGVSTVHMLMFLMGQMFNEYSIYRMEQLNKLEPGISTSSVSRFLRNPRFHWENLLSLVSKAVYGFITGLNNKDEKWVFTADDSDLDRVIRSRHDPICPGKANKKTRKVRKHKGKRTELVAHKYDHARHVYSNGFRMLVLGLASKQTFIPAGIVLLSSKEDKVVRGDKDLPDFARDKRSIAYKRRKIARMGTIPALIQMILRALKHIKSVNYLCADRWFSTPSMIYELRSQTGLHVISVLKHNSTYFLFNGERKTITQIYQEVKKRPGAAKYLSEVMITVPGKGGKTHQVFEAKVVFVRNRANRKQWIALISTDVNLSAEDIIEYYSLRWKTETYFWTAKKLLHLNDECHATSYDAITAHCTIVALRYIMMETERRRATDGSPIGQMLAICMAEEEDENTGKTILETIDLVFEVLVKNLKLSDEQMNKFIEGLLEILPDRIKNMLKLANSAENYDDDPPKRKRKSKSKSKVKAGTKGKNKVKDQSAAKGKEKESVA